MLVGKVAGSMYATIEHGFFAGRRKLLVDLTTPEGTPNGKYLVAVDTVDAGVGDMVLIVDEGNGARQIFQDTEAPVRSVIVGIVDAITV